MKFFSITHIENDDICTARWPKWIRSLPDRSADKGLLTDGQLKAKAPNKFRNLIRWRKKCLTEVTVSLSPRHTQTGMYALASISAALQLPVPLSLTEKSLPVLHSRK